MSGNVWEWTWDWYGGYPEGRVRDPLGYDEGSLRVSRGGGWGGRARGCRSADRGGVSPDGRDRVLGFRLVRSVP